MLLRNGRCRISKSKKSVTSYSVGAFRISGSYASVLSKKISGLRLYNGNSNHHRSCLPYSITLLEQLSREHKLPKILLATTEPSHYPSLAKAAVSSKISGSLRLFFKGMPYQKDDLQFILKAVSKNGILPCFAGICAGGNSLLSYPFYEYFRQNLCDFLGNLVESGEYPNYADLLKKFVKDITFETLNSYL